MGGRAVPPALRASINITPEAKPQSDVLPLAWSLIYLVYLVYLIYLVYFEHLHVHMALSWNP